MSTYDVSVLEHRDMNISYTLTVDVSEDICDIDMNFPDSPG